MPDTKMILTIDSMITISNFTSTEQNVIIKDNRYPNPAINEAKRMKRAYHYLPQYVYTYQQKEDSIIVPLGYLSELLGYFPSCTIIDQRTIAPAHIPELAGVSLRDYQHKAVSQAIQYDNGIIQSGTGSGKTIMGLALIHLRQQRTLILTHSKELMTQWQDEIKKLMGLDVGIIGGGKETQTDITIAMLQTLSKRPELLKELSSTYGLVLVEECHHIPSNTFSMVINSLSAHYKYGLSATIHRRDGLHQLINRHIGIIIARVSDKQIHEVGGILPVTVATYRTHCRYQVKSWNDYLKAITADPERNSLITHLALKSSHNVPTLILCDRVEHTEVLSSMLSDTGQAHLLIHGQLPIKERQVRMQAITEHMLTIGTTGLLGEGLDISGWTTLILANPISSRVKLLQAVGRVIRPAPNKKNCYVIDLIDNCAFSYSSYKKRLSIYKEKCYTLIERDHTKQSREVA